MSEYYFAFNRTVSRLVKWLAVSTILVGQVNLLTGHGMVDTVSLHTTVIFLLLAWAMFPMVELVIEGLIEWVDRKEADV